MSTFIHEWGRPQVVVFLRGTDGEGRRLRPTHVAIQDCDRCGARRNAISLVMIRWSRRDWCRDAPPRSDMDWRDELKRVRAELQTIRSAGDYVDAYFTGRKTDRPAPVA